MCSTNEAHPWSFVTRYCVFFLLIELPLQRLVESKQMLPHYLPIILERLGDIDSNFYSK